VANEALVQSIKQIMALAKSGDVDGANARWGELFGAADFASNRPEDQRQALKLFVLAKRTGEPTPSLVDAHRAAIPSLEGLVDAHREPQDYELLGMCKVLAGDEAGASAAFRAGLELERAKDEGSDLCGRLMKHVASI
jgi:hypothetical protein